jgi:cytochrome c oxidase cbb3-type subunit 1
VQEQTTYNYKVVRQFSIMTVVWGVVGMLVGVTIAAQLMFPDMAYGVSWLSYGRLRPLHTNAVIFAFGGPLDWSRTAIYSTGFFAFWAVCAASSALTCFLQRSPSGEDP